MTALRDAEDNPPNERPTSPFGSEPPFPQHDSLPAEMVGESKTEPAPDPQTQAIVDAVLAALSPLLTRILDEQNASLSLVFERIGEVREAQQRSDQRQEDLAVETDKRLEAAITAARDGANAALDACARVESLRQAIDDQFGTGNELAGTGQ